MVSNGLGVAQNPSGLFTRELPHLAMRSYQTRDRHNFSRRDHSVVEGNDLIMGGQWQYSGKNTFFLVGNVMDNSR